MSSDNENGRIVTETRGRVRLIGIDRPEKYNGFTPEMIEALAKAYTEFEEDSEVFCALLHSTSKHFTAGLQLDRFRIDEPLQIPGLVDPLGLGERKRTKPVVTAVSGICFTIGIELMLAADIVVAAEGTRFGQLEVKRGLMAYGGATIRMVERAGWGNAMRWLLTGDEFDAGTALRIGFVQEVVSDGDAMARGLAIAESVAKQAPLAVSASMVNARLAVEQSPQAAIDAFPGQLASLAASEDFAEGVRSFVERRDGNYKGR